MSALSDEERAVLERLEREFQAADSVGDDDVVRDLGDEHPLGAAHAGDAVARGRWTSQRMRMVGMVVVVAVLVSAGLFGLWWAVAAAPSPTLVPGADQPLKGDLSEGDRSAAPLTDAPEPVQSPDAVQSTEAIGPVGSVEPTESSGSGAAARTASPTQSGELGRSASTPPAPKQQRAGGEPPAPTAPRGGVMDPEKASVANAIISPIRKASPVETATGTATLPKGSKELWLLLEIPTDGAPLFYPGEAPLTLDGEGKWSQSIYIGQDGDPAGAKYTLHLVAVDSKLASALASYRSTEAATGVHEGLTKAQLDGADFLARQKLQR